MIYGQPAYYNYGNGQNNGYNPQQAQGYYNSQPQSPSAIPIIPPKTNKILVTSLIDALNRTPEPNTEFLYIDQDNPFIYQVTIDMQGRKSYKTFEITEVTEQSAQKLSPELDMSVYATKEDLKALEDRLLGMASSLIPTKTKTKTEKTGGDE